MLGIVIVIISLATTVNLFYNICTYKLLIILEYYITTKVQSNVRFTSLTQSNSQNTTHSAQKLPLPLNLADSRAHLFSSTDLLGKGQFT